LSSDEFNISYIKQTHFLSILFYHFFLYVDNEETTQIILIVNYSIC